MIQIKRKKFQVLLWQNADRSGTEPSLELAFDTREEAEAAFNEQTSSGRYQAAIMVEFRQKAGIWNLLRSHPAEDE